MEPTTTELAAQIDMLLARIDQLEREHRPVYSVSEPSSPTPTQAVGPGPKSPKSSRRNLLRGGAAVLGAGAVAGGLGTRPASAADGDNLIAGASNTASTITSLTSSSTFALKSESSVESGVGVLGKCLSDGNDGHGIIGTTASNSGSGVMGEATSTVDDADGVYGESAAPSGGGIRGHASHPTGSTYGVRGTASSPDGAGVLGVNLGADGVAIRGHTLGGGVGIRGTTAGGNSIAVEAVQGVFGSASFAGAGPMSIVPRGTETNRSPEAPIHVQQNGSADPVELLLLLESDTPPQQVFKNNTTGTEWFFAVTSDDEFKISKNGTGSVEAKFFGNGNLRLNGTLTELSDENAKRNLVPVDAAAVLDQVAAMPISTWQYNADPGVTHLGPTAQDFSAAFGLGDTTTGIANVDANGVALAAIKALQAENYELRQQVEELYKLVSTVDQSQH